MGCLPESRPAVSATEVTLLDNDSVEEKTPPSDASPSSLDEHETDPEAERAEEKDVPRRAADDDDER